MIKKINKNRMQAKVIILNFYFDLGMATKRTE